MATPPKSTTPQAKAAAPPASRPQQPAIPPTPQVEPQNFNIHGVMQGPRPDMAPEADTSKLTDATLAEMEAGKKALAQYQARTQAELDLGKKLVERRGGAPVKTDSHSESE